MFWLEPGALSQAERNIVYLCRPEVRWMKIIAGQSRAFTRTVPSEPVNLVFASLPGGGVSLTSGER